MAYAYPIWHTVQSCHYKSDKSYGGKDNSIDTIVVGSSAMNSHEFVETKTLRRFYLHEKHGNVCSFKYYVDDVKIKEKLFKDNNGKAGEYIETWSLFDTLNKLTRSQKIKDLCGRK